MKKDTEVSNYQRVLSSFMGSSLTALILTPLDVVRIRLQSQPSPTHSTFSTLKMIFKQEGFFQLWRGLTATLIMGVPASAIYMVSYENTKFYLINHYDLDVPKSSLLSGSLSRTWAAMCISPLELLRTRIQQTGNEQKSFSMIIKGMSEMVQKEGLGSLWRGLSPTLWRDIPFSALYWYNYEFLKAYQTKFLFIHQPYQDLTTPSQFLISFISGFTSGLFSSFLTTPFDVVKTRKQMEYANHEKIHLSMLQWLHKIYQEGGLRHCWTGAVARMSKVAPSCAIMISVYELVSSIMVSLTHVPLTAYRFSKHQTEMHQEVAANKVYMIKCNPKMIPLDLNLEWLMKQGWNQHLDRLRYSPEMLFMRKFDPQQDFCIVIQLLDSMTLTVYGNDEQKVQLYFHSLFIGQFLDISKEDLNVIGSGWVDHPHDLYFFRGTVHAAFGVWGQYLVDQQMKQHLGEELSTEIGFK